VDSHADFSRNPVVLQDLSSLRLGVLFFVSAAQINVIATPRLVLAFNLDAGQLGSLTALSAPAPFVTEIDATHENATVLRSVLALALVE
jgi:hypothetical protein